MEPIFSADSGVGGVFTPPADKSITHRALMLAAICAGTSRIRNPLRTGDCLSTQSSLEALGVESTWSDHRQDASAELVIQGVGLRGFKEPSAALDAENSGTTTRLLSGLVAGLPIFAVLTGDSSLARRPMGRVVEPLRKMGGRIEGREGGKFLPLCFLPGSGSLSAIRYTLPVASAQVKSAILLAGLRADGETLIDEAAGSSRDHTERLLGSLGVPLAREGASVRLLPVSSLPAFSIDVPGDVSSAAFFMAAALISQRGLEVRDCGLNPTRLGFVEALRRMGATVTIHVERSSLGEPIGSIQVQPAPLAATIIQPQEVPDLIDELPLVAVLGLFARGRTEVRGAGELKHKESDRLEMVGRLAESLGGRIEITGDGFIVDGPQRLHPGRVDPRGDHRIAMAAAVAGVGIRGGVRVAGFEAARVSYPDFIDHFRRLGGSVA